MKKRSLALFLGSAIAVTACDGLREALTAHVDVAARAEAQELSVTRLSDMLGRSALQIPVNRETAMILSDLWLNYQLLGVAAAHGDSTADAKLIDEATIGITSNIRLRRYMEGIAKSATADSGSDVTYTQALGGIFVARHILFPVAGGATQPQKDSVKRKAEGIRAQLTTANFAAMAKKHSADPGSAVRGGDLGAFRREDMVKPFGDAVAALRPGDISPVIETSYGYHVIQRPTYANAKAQYDPVFVQGSQQRAESVFVARIDDESKINVKSNAATAAKGAARDITGHRDDKEVIATYKGGELTNGRFARWVESYPPQMRLAQQMAQAPDSLVRQFVKSIARNEIMLKKADTAGVALTPEETKNIHGEYTTIVTQLWGQLGLEPKSLADSAKSVPERERLAARRVEAYLDAVMAGRAQPLSVPSPVKNVLMAKFKAKLYQTGIDRGVERAKKLRASEDSTRAAQQPSSQVPLPTPPADTAPRDTSGRGKRP